MLHACHDSTGPKNDWGDIENSKEHMAQTGVSVP
jgi:hypothetical protein